MNNKRNYFSFSLVIFCLISLSETRGIFDYSHIEGTELSILAGKISSRSGIIPYAYNNLQICDSESIIKTEDTIGEILTGEKLFTTGYVTNVNKNKFCEILCCNNFNKLIVEKIKTLIERFYVTNWYLDKLPAGLISYNKEKKETFINYFNGIPLGFKEDDNYYIYNHLQFHIILNKIDENKFVVVGFNILPISINHEEDRAVCSKEAKNNLENNFKNNPQILKEGEILFTYDTIYEYSNITLASRWDHYKPSSSKIHWTGIIFSDVIISVFSVIIGYIFIKNIKEDIDKYNYQVVKIGNIEEYGWKQVSGDVFRAPRTNHILLSSIIGTGIQLFFMFSITLFLGLFGYMKPEKRTNILNLGILLYCFMGLPGGFISSVIYRIFGGKNWLKNSLLTAVLFPGILLFGFIIVNAILTIEKSTASVPISDIFSLFFLWIFFTSPLIIIGSFFGIKTRNINLPCTISPIPSVVPEKPWYLHYKFMTFVTGFICFLTIFIEFNYVMSSLWRHKIYFIATFLWMSFNLFIIVSGEVSILVVYWNLCKGDYNWWWKSFLMGGSPVIYFIVYSIYYFFYLKITSIPATIVYFGIMALISAMALFICGSTSVIITFGFLLKIYSAIKID